MKILLVEDDERIAQPLIEELQQQHTVDHVSNGLVALEYAINNAYELILLDIMLPGLDGISLCRQLRKSGCSTQILMLTARDTTPDKVLGLDAGADDYLVKPFDLDELSARIRALSRRSASIKSQIIEYTGLALDSISRRVNYRGFPITLTPKEFALLECFLQHPDRVFTKSLLIDKLWEIDQDAGEETIKTHMTNLRRKLRDVGVDDEFIETVYGVGYRLSRKSS